MYGQSSGESVTNKRNRKSPPVVAPTSLRRATRNTHKTPVAVTYLLFQIQV